MKVNRCVKVMMMTSKAAYTLFKAGRRANERGLASLSKKTGTVGEKGAGAGSKRTRHGQTLEGNSAVSEPGEWRVGRRC